MTTHPERGDPLRRPRGRYAPSPTGELHLGNASSALLAWLSIRARKGTFVMRMEDLDRGRVREGYARQILDDLRWFGIDWDEGPVLGGPFTPYDQWSRRELYRAGFERLRADGRLYPCFCSRKDIAAAASAPQTPGDERRYSGRCRALDPADAARRVEEGARHAWRFRVGARHAPRFDDLVRGGCGCGPAPGDFVVQRSDGVPAYQLAVVVDDDAMQIDEVVRGDDLLDSTGRQILLFRALGLPVPRFGHVPLLLGSDGVRLSKRHRGITLRELRESGMSAERVTGMLAALLQLRPTDEPVAAAELIDEFALSDLAQAREGIVVPTEPVG